MPKAPDKELRNARCLIHRMPDKTCPTAGGLNFAPLRDRFPLAHAVRSLPEIALSKCGKSIQLRASDAHLVRVLLAHAGSTPVCSTNAHSVMGEIPFFPTMLAGSMDLGAAEATQARELNPSIERAPGLIAARRFCPHGH